jgi:hypothetical protein
VDYPESGCRAWVLGVACLLLLAAGYRVQHRLDKYLERQGLRDMLGRRLTLGRHLLASITLAAGLAFAEERAVEWPDPHSDVAKEGSRTQEEIKEWERATEEFLHERLGYSYAARFRTHAGLPRIDAPYDWFSGGWREQWERVAHGLMRLEEFIKETPPDGR